MKNLKHDFKESVGSEKLPLNHRSMYYWIISVKEQSHKYFYITTAHSMIIVVEFINTYAIIIAYWLGLSKLQKYMTSLFYFLNGDILFYVHAPLKNLNWIMLVPELKFGS